MPKPAPAFPVLETPRLRRFEAFIHPENVASIRLAERLGFRLEGGPLADYWCVGDQFMSVMIYARVSS
jgi:[ribosomal protein S5]-alanine N-acetyltransferase